MLLYNHRNQQVRTPSMFHISGSRKPARLLLDFQWQDDKGKREGEPAERQGKGSIWVASRSHLHRVIPTERVQPFSTHICPLTAIGHHKAERWQFISKRQFDIHVYGRMDTLDIVLQHLCNTDCLRTISCLALP